MSPHNMNKEISIILFFNIHSSMSTNNSHRIMTPVPTNDDVDGKAHEEEPTEDGEILKFYSKFLSKNLIF